eukprot:comp5064_c0_seq2/m.4150 comp5064_c0_seq2/g.4150  ORF comp5064_c0_seq2/g.4150 comp5064_c0_seq2/m.4150 type:complete len:498 (-) comp5064_c0_seq2:296-1789(-)
MMIMMLIRSMTLAAPGVLVFALSLSTTTIIIIITATATTIIVVVVLALVLLAALVIVIRILKLCGRLAEVNHIPCLEPRGSQGRCLQRKGIALRLRIGAEILVVSVVEMRVQCLLVLAQLALEIGAVCRRSSQIMVCVAHKADDCADIDNEHKHDDESAEVGCRLDPAQEKDAEHKRRPRGHQRRKIKQLSLNVVKRPVKCVQDRNKKHKPGPKNRLVQRVALEEHKNQNHHKLAELNHKLPEPRLVAVAAIQESHALHNHPIVEPRAVAVQADKRPERNPDPVEHNCNHNACNRILEMAARPTLHRRVFHEIKRVVNPPAREHPQPGLQHRRMHHKQDDEEGRKDARLEICAREAPLGRQDASLREEDCGPDEQRENQRHGREHERKLGLVEEVIGDLALQRETVESKRCNAAHIGKRVAHRLGPVQIILANNRQHLAVVEEDLENHTDPTLVDGRLWDVAARSDLCKHPGFFLRGSGLERRTHKHSHHHHLEQRK